MTISLRDLLLPPPLLVAIGIILATTNAPKLVREALEMPIVEEIEVQSATAEVVEGDVVLLIHNPTPPQTIVTISENPVLSETRARWVSLSLDAQEMDKVTAPTTPTETSAPEPELIEEPPLTFLGRIGEGETHRALLRNSETGQDKWFELGEAFENWTVVEIRPNGVLFRVGEQEFLARLNR